MSYVNTYTFEQTTSSTLWEVAHNLGTTPAVDVYFYDTSRSAYVKMIPMEVEYVDANNIKIHFSEPYSGKVSVSV
jgi:hypothetical protein